MMFYRGQKVICVDTWPPQTLFAWLRRCWDEWRHPYTHPIKGNVYTVERVHINDETGALCLDLVELTDGRDFWDGFWACGFRPVVERKTDISVFKAMLNSKKTEVDA